MLRHATCLKCTLVIVEPSANGWPSCARCGAKFWRVLLDAEVTEFEQRFAWRLSPGDLRLLRGLRIAAEVPEVG